jgi:hypothetical protein
MSKEAVDHNSAFVKMAQDFINAITGEASDLQTGWEGLEMLELVSHCSKSPFHLRGMESEHVRR